MTQIKSISGYTKTRSAEELDADRYEFITLDQTEPNPGNPDSDGALFVSDIDGTRSFTSDPLLSGLSFRSLPQYTPQYVLVLDPTSTPGDRIDPDRVGWSTFPTLDNDTLYTVTRESRGVGYDSTDTALTMYAVTTVTDANIGRDLVVEGNLTVNGTRTILNTEVMTVEDRNIVIAEGAVNALGWDSSGIIVDGANVKMLYHTSTDTWDFNRGLQVTNTSIFDQDVTVTGDVYANTSIILNSGATQDIQKTNGILRIINDDLKLTDASSGNIMARFSVGDISLNEILTVSDSATFNGVETIFNGEVFLTDVPLKELDTKVLFRRTSDGLIMEGDVDVAALADLDKVFLKPTDSDAVFYPLLSYAQGGIEGNDSAEFDLNLTYQPNTNTLSVVNVDVSGLTNLDSTFVVGDFKLNTTDESSVSGRLLDSAGRSLVIYDSVGYLLWGNSGVSAGNVGALQYGGPGAAQLYLNDIVDVQLTSLVEGQVIKWDGVNFVNAPDQTGGGAGGGLTLNDLAAITNTPAGTGSLTYSDITGVFNYTPPLTRNSLKKLDDVDPSLAPNLNQVLKWDGAQWTAADDDASAGGTGDPNQNAYGFLTDGLNIQNATSATDTITVSGSGGIAVTVGASNVLTIDGSGVGGTGTAISVTDESTQLTAGVTSFTFTGAGVTATTSGDDVSVTIPGAAAGTLPTRDVLNVTVFNITNNGTTGEGSVAAAGLAGYSSYALFKIQTSQPCWVRMYTDDTSRSNDNRTIEQDPSSDAGIVAEVITTQQGQVVKMSPGVLGWLENGQDIPLKVTNLSGSTQSQIVITFTILQLEA